MNIRNTLLTTSLLFSFLFFGCTAHIVKHHPGFQELFHEDPEVVLEKVDIVEVDHFYWIGEDV